MRKIVYTEEELKINKVLKMNQDMSTSLLSDSGLKASRAAADDNIASSLALLESLHGNTDTGNLSSQFGVGEKEQRIEHRPQMENWETLVAEAESYVPNIVTLEDILSEEEIQDAYAELDEINR